MSPWYSFSNGLSRCIEAISSGVSPNSSSNSAILSLSSASGVNCHSPSPQPSLPTSPSALSSWRRLEHAALNFFSVTPFCFSVFFEKVSSPFFFSGAFISFKTRSPGRTVRPSFLSLRSFARTALNIAISSVVRRILLRFRLWASASSAHPRCPCISVRIFSAPSLRRNRYIADGDTFASPPLTPLQDTRMCT